MGSTGSNSFGNYAPTTTKCDQAVDAVLEDVMRLDFYKTNGKLPLVGTLVRLREGVVSGRMVVEDAATNLVIGNLPTYLHYLRLCQENGYKYEGTVTISQSIGVPGVEVHLEPV